AVDLHRAGAALAGLAVPPAGQVGRLGGLQPVDDVEDDLALVHLDLEVAQVTAARVAAPDTEVAFHGASTSDSSSSVRYFASSARSNRESSSARIFGTGLRSRCTSPFSSSEQTRLMRRHSGLI